MTRKRKLLLMIPIGIAAITLFVFVGGHVVRLLWNTLMPPIFGLPVVTFWQAFGLLALARILFGGLGHGCGRSGMRRRMSENWERLTPEEREKIHARMRERWGFSPRDPAGNKP